LGARRQCLVLQLLAGRRAYARRACLMRPGSRHPFKFVGWWTPDDSPAATYRTPPGALLQRERLGMTVQKRRVPLTTDAALARIAGQVPGGWAAMATHLGREKGESLVRKWGDPQCRERIPFDDAIKLDLLYRDTGGDGAPMFETYAYQLDEAGMFRFADEIALGRLAALVIRECGEASAGLVLSAQPGADPAEHRLTLGHVDDAIDAYQRARVLVAALANGGRIDSATLLADLAGDPRATGPPK